MGKGTLLVQPVMGGVRAEPVAPLTPAPVQPPEPYPVQPPPAYADPHADPDTPERIPLGLWLFERAINGTVGSFSVDLKRPHAPRAGARTLLTYSRAAAEAEAAAQARARGGYGGYGGGYYPRRARPRPLNPQAQEQRRQFVDTATLPAFAFGDTGARVKALRHVRFGPEFTATKHGRTETQPQLDFGFGGSFELDTATFKPLLRLKIRDAASLQLLPEPALRLHHRVRLGTSGLGVRLSYECPLEGLPRFYAPPARLLLTLDNAVDNGVKITQSGVELNADRWAGEGTRLRAQGVLHFPTELPVDEDATLFRFEAKRLGLKGRW